MNCFTKTGQWELRVDFEFQNKTRSYLHYNKFKIGSATDEYPLTIGGFTGITPTDPFATHPLNGRKFSTYDNDNDLGPKKENCAAEVLRTTNNGGWWFNRCWEINVNFNYVNTGTHKHIKLAGIWYNLNAIEMKIRPLNCTPQ